jgi:very-short-patch-repair endonuclease
MFSADLVPVKWPGFAERRTLRAARAQNTAQYGGARHASCARGRCARPLHRDEEALLKKSQLSPARAQLLAARAATMRASLTYSEQRLWQAIRSRQLGVGFRRQFVIGNFIADFCAPTARLVVEIDGGYHAGRAVADARRDRSIQALGFRVLRFSAERIERELSGVLEQVRQAIAAR